MMRSLFSGVSGLKTHQTKMDVIGNNIANVNTTAYKSSSIVFSDLVSQTTQRASGPNATTGRGGVNARQIGLGVKSGAINSNITDQGSTQSTGNPFDIMINGSNFFIVSNGQENFFTREGSFYVDAAGNLATTSLGYNVMGWQVVEEEVDVTGADGNIKKQKVENIKKEEVSALRILSAANMTYPPAATERAHFAGIIDKNDTDVTSDNGRVVNLNFFDELGYSYTARFVFKQDANVKENYKLSLESIKDSKGVEIDLGGKNLTDLFKETDVKFDSKNGLLKEPAAKEVALTLSAIPSGNFKDITIEMEDISMYDNKGSSTIGATSGSNKEKHVGEGSGRRLGEMIGVSIEQSGLIYASYDNGMTRLLGQIASASFPNASGLEKKGDNLYSATMNSGEFDGIGQDITDNGGYFSTGQLEMSNVDLSTEFTEMITTQRGFQANSRIITVSDTLLEELTNLKR